MFFQNLGSLPVKLTKSQFFVDLWNELQTRAKKSSVDDNLAEAMSYEDVKNSTSASVGSDDDGGLFDETINAYEKRRDHAERLIIESVKYSLPAALRSYINKPNWLTVDNSDNGNCTSPMRRLVPYIY